ncbi:MAG: signal recognition particle-docking protein FtsY [Desulfovibrio sp.]|jgi:fused signal recognition particle receptor|nr:signal recognition particle-docking protein FtsY [Desulfovibrio sp.]
MGFFSSLGKIFSGGAARTSSAPPLLSGSVEEEDLTLALRAAEPRLSVWLDVVLAGVETPGPLLWSRLSLLLAALETPGEEREAFVSAFQSWLQGMEYTRLEDFRSELQYRLALALDLEDEEDERSRLLLRISRGLAKTRERIALGLDALFAGGRILDAAFWEELEEVLIFADVGVEAARTLSGRLRSRALREGIRDSGALREALREELCAVFKPARRITALNPPEVILMVGVNGVGKTTTIAKLCHRAVLQGKKVLLAAGDTFRAAAVEQLEIWAGRAGAGFYAKGEGADPAAVAFEAVDKALAEGYDTLFVDTAGRLHTKTNLMEELVKIRRVLGRRHPGAPHRVILVLDATSGQNALAQVKLFRETAKADEIILTKLDGTAKGGIAVAVASRFNLPISFVGLGEKLEDLRPFDSRAFVGALLDGQPRR